MSGEAAMLKRHWWALVLRGVCALIFGVLTITWPQITIAVLVIFFGAFALVDGIFALICALTSRGAGHRVALIFQGILGVAAGVVAFGWPGITAIALLYVIAFWALVTGVFEIIASLRLAQGTHGRGLLGVSGLISVVFGLLLVRHPLAGILTIAIIIGAYAIVAGIVLIFLGITLKGEKKPPVEPGAA